ncbi:MAG: peptide chain release factor N(5)-glutamine methyltransferase [Anaerolineaceae bacterium]|nr:peptide chain release factor N(5)-glutamine methyltransferase [Anaerolineaceae bacterium]
MNTVAAALRAATQTLGAGSDTAALDAQLLLAQVSGRGRAWLLAHGDRPLTPPQARRFSALVARRARGEPLAYIRRRQAFFDRDFHVSPAVLIPRPESEQLLELALGHTAQDFGGTVADVGTGSGALGIAFAALRPRARVILTDISPAALAVARVNARRHGVKPTFLQGDLLDPLLARGERVDLLLANLPYVRSADLPGLDVSRHEPWIALDGGPEGMDLIRRLLGNLRCVCQPGALVLLEIGMQQGAEALRLAQGLRPRQARVLQDLAGLDRVLRVKF